MSAAPRTEELVQTPAQLQQRLWADPAVQVYAVAMAHRFPDLPDRLAAALARRELVDADCLWPGAQSSAQRQQAPYLLQLKQASAFTHWLLFQACEDHGGWGVLLRGAPGRLAMRGHLRQLSAVRLPDGGVASVDWMDPEVLALLLPRFDSPTLVDFCGPVTDWILPSVDAWQWVRTSHGRLSTQLLRLHRTG